MKPMPGQLVIELIGQFRSLIQMSDRHKHVLDDLFFDIYNCVSQVRRTEMLFVRKIKESPSVFKTLIRAIYMSSV